MIPREDDDDDDKSAITKANRGVTGEDGGGVRDAAANFTPASKTLQFTTSRVRNKT